MRFAGAGKGELKIQQVAFQCLCCGQFSARFVLLLFSCTHTPPAPQGQGTNWVIPAWGENGGHLFCQVLWEAVLGQVVTQ